MTTETPRYSRRSLFKAAAVVGGTTLVGTAVGVLSDDSSSPSVSPSSPSVSPSPEHAELFGTQTISSVGLNQPGITTPMQANLVMVAFSVRDGVQPVDARRLLTVVSSDIEGLMSGRGGVADSDRELALFPSNLTVTVGVGPRFFDRFGISKAKPAWLEDLPSYRIDALEEKWSGGDFVLQLCSDDQITLANARRLLVSQTRRWLDIAWMQTGFSGARGARPQGQTMRNLMGQVDGTVNVDPQVDHDLIFMSNQGVWAGGSTMVVRRIAMNLETWEEVDRVGREDSTGRTISSGAPLSGGDEFTPVDFEATSDLGFPKVPSYSHVRRAHSDNPNEVIYRRAYNYDDAPDTGQTHNTGLVFVSFQASVQKQYQPIQQRLAELDALNEWTTPIGSAVFAVLPGAGDSSYIGASVLEPYLAKQE